jgi:CheY-like chemotaxis protein
LKSRVAVQGARILWIDDHPEWSDWEHRVLEELGTHVIWATTTGKALEILASQSIDLILSDIARGDDEQAGLSGLTQIRQVHPDTPLVFYVSDLNEEKGPPAGSSGITNRPDELLHLVLDVLERGRG